MPPTEKPKWCWRYPADDNEELDARLAEVKPDDILRLIPVLRAEDKVLVTSRVEVALTQFYWAKFGSPPPTKGEIIAALDAFRKATEEFAFCLKNLDDYSRDLLQRRFESYYEGQEDAAEQAKVLGYYVALFDEPSTVLGLTEFLAKALRTSGMKRPPRKKGRRADIALIGLIADLAEIYETYSGQSATTGFHFDPDGERYRGALVTLTEHVLQRFVPDLKIAQNSIGDHIRRIVGDRADPRWQKYTSDTGNLPFPWNYDPMLPRYGYEITVWEPTDDGSVRERTIRSEPVDE